MSRGGQLPGIEPSDRAQLVLHVDNDCFYAACERLREPQLCGKPVVVGMGFEPDSTAGAVATASYEAREYGIESAQSISEATECLPPASQVSEDHSGPTAHYRPVDMEYYQDKAKQVTDILQEHSAVLRSVSIDEAYLDCTDRTTWNTANEFGQRIRGQIETEVGLPVSIGIAPNMSVAKIASDYDKPAGLVVVTPDEVQSFLAPLPIEALHGIGPKTAERLSGRAIQTIGDLARCDAEWVITEFGERGRELQQRAQGIDRRSVTPRGKPKSLSRESSFGEPTADEEVIQNRLTELGNAVAERAQQRGATYQTIGIKVVEPPFAISTREQTLPGPVDDSALVRSIATELFDEFVGEQVRKVGVRVSNLSFATGDQRGLEDWSTSASDDTRSTKSALNHSVHQQQRLSSFIDKNTE